MSQCSLLPRSYHVPIVHPTRLPFRRYSSLLRRPCSRPSRNSTCAPSGPTSWRTLSQHGPTPSSPRSSTLRPSHTTTVSPVHRPTPILPRRGAAPSFDKTPLARHKSTSSTAQWLTRQRGDRFAKQAKVAGLKSRAAFKLLQINDKHRLFKPGQTVLDLGFAPGSWSQVAIEMVRPGGRVIGVDVIPAVPPRGVSTIMGDFGNEGTREEIRRFLVDPERGRVRSRNAFLMGEEEEEAARMREAIGRDVVEDVVVEREDGHGYLDHAKVDAARDEVLGLDEVSEEDGEHKDKVIDVVLSDMSAPWDLLEGMHSRSLSNPYRRMMNTSGNRFRDHAGSMVRVFSLSVFPPSWPTPPPQLRVL